MYVFCTTKEGCLKGRIQTDINNTPFVSFLGVPYARAPTGKLRFKAPQCPEKWEGIRDATEEGPSCYCRHIWPTEQGFELRITGSEDCLALNIFTRDLFKTGLQLKPVMVFIHGGGFVFGSNSLEFYNPETLMTEDIVLVVLNYRLGALGFLTIDSPDLGVTGNAGLKDQLQALEWIQENIKNFGGDPNNVTIFGQSAGAASVHFLVLSPKAKGLFHKAIMQSGSALCPWSRGSNDAKKLAQKMGCKETDSNEKILDFLQAAPVEQLLRAQLDLQDGLKCGRKRNFSPSIEEKSENSLLTEKPLSIMNSGCYNHVPLMIGYTSCEGAIESLLEDKEVQLNSSDFVPFYFELDEGSAEYEKVRRRIVNFYFEKDDLDLANTDAYHRICSDTIFLRGIYKSVKSHVKTNKKPVYFYRMSADTKLNTFSNKMNKKINGACHCDELGYLFKHKNIKVEPKSIEELVLRRFVKLWTNFAKTGNPIPEKDSLLNVDWKPVSHELNYLEIGNELVEGVDPDIERMIFWDEVSEGREESF